MGKKAIYSLKKRRFLGIQPLKSSLLEDVKKHNLTGYATVVGQMGKASQFPSNGNAETKWVGIRHGLHQNRRVSIPFKRESGSKVYQAKTAVEGQPLFQFPSNGKTETKDPSGWLAEWGSKSFNSLQTGKLRQSGIVNSRYNSETGSSFQFPSNGKTETKWYCQQSL